MSRNRKEPIMAYKNLGAFLTKVTLKAISKLDQADVDECMRIAENVVAWANAGTITSEQLDELLAALPVDMAVEEPEAEPDVEPETPDYSAMTKAELLEEAANRGVEAYESWTKAEIIAALEGAE